MFRIEGTQSTLERPDEALLDHSPRSVPVPTLFVTH